MLPVPGSNGRSPPPPRPDPGRAVIGRVEVGRSGVGRPASGRLTGAPALGCPTCGRSVLVPPFSDRFVGATLLARTAHGRITRASERVVATAGRTRTIAGPLVLLFRATAGPPSVRIDPSYSERTLCFGFRDGYFCPPLGPRGSDLRGPRWSEPGSLPLRRRPTAPLTGPSARPTQYLLLLPRFQPLPSPLPPTLPLPTSNPRFVRPRA